MRVTFQYEEAFWLLGLLPLFILLFIIYKRWKRRKVKEIGDSKLVMSLIQTHSFKKENIKFFIFIFSFALGCVALANPRLPDAGSAEQRSGIDIMIALDVSRSMLATDVPPIRLHNAQQLLNAVLDKMPNDRVGLILFAGKGYLQMPLSTDHNAAKLFISTAHPDVVPEPGTAIADALESADLAFENNDRFKTIILITDGETHDEDALDKAQELSKKGIMINTIGIGSVQGSTIIDSTGKSTKTDEAGNVIISKLNEELLQNIASITNGAYVHFNSIPPTVNVLADQYANVEKKALMDESSMNYISFYWWLVLPMLLLLLVDLFLSDKKRIKQ